jgi:hypothetical protein
VPLKALNDNQPVILSPSLFVILSEAKDLAQGRLREESPDAVLSYAKDSSSSRFHRDSSE